MSFHSFAKWTAVLALCVIVLGAFVRLSHAGLGCPDWPGCYGQLTWPVAEGEVAQANADYPERPVSTTKAWKEMVHRYLAGTLGLCILGLAIAAWRGRHKADRPLALCMFLVVIVLFQATLGMWTVTLKLKPLVVMGHLVFGFATFALLVWVAMATREKPISRAQAGGARTLFFAALIGLIAQVMLGGWVSSNYAAVACTDFPTCQAEWWPPMDFKEGFKPWRGIGVDYEGGVLDVPARTAIHMTHRLGAIGASLLILLAVAAAMRHSALRGSGMLLASLLVVQIGLGITNVVGGLPLAVAAAHNGVAALLVVTLVALLFRTRRVIP